MKYYMSLETLVEVNGKTEKERFDQAKQKFIELFQNDNIIEIEVVDQDDSED